MLFVCQLNRARSATAERLFCKRPDLEVCLDIPADHGVEDALKEADHGTQHTG